MSNGRNVPKAAVQMLVFTELEMAAFDPKQTFTKWQEAANTCRLSSLVDSQDLLLVRGWFGAHDSRSNGYSRPNDLLTL